MKQRGMRDIDHMEPPETHIRKVVNEKKKMRHTQ